MKKSRISEEKMEKREDIRNNTDTAIGLSPFTTCCDTRLEEGILRNYSLNGMVIESGKSYPKGCVLVVKVLKTQKTFSQTVAEDGFRSVSLAEVKWLQDRENAGASRYRIGLKYLR